jgi:hypothetical protein
MFITVFTTARVVGASAHPHAQLSLDAANGFFPLGFPSKILYKFIISLLCIMQFYQALSCLLPN